MKLWQKLSMIEGNPIKNHKVPYTFYKQLRLVDFNRFIHALMISFFVLLITS